VKRKARPPANQDRETFREIHATMDRLGSLRLNVTGEGYRVERIDGTINAGPGLVITQTTPVTERAADPAVTLMQLQEKVRGLRTD
jgi:hypothetical protein